MLLVQHLSEPPLIAFIKRLKKKQIKVIRQASGYLVSNGLNYALRQRVSIKPAERIRTEDTSKI
jgi:hypothetical protein